MVYKKLREAIYEGESAMRTEMVRLTNLCMIKNEYLQNRELKKDWQGYTFLEGI